MNIYKAKPFQMASFEYMLDSLKSELITEQISNWICYMRKMQYMTSRVTIAQVNHFYFFRLNSNLLPLKFLRNNLQCKLALLFISPPIGIGLCIKHNGLACRPWSLHDTVIQCRFDLNRT